MDTLTGDRVEVRSEGRRQSLALTGLHLGDVAEMECRAAHDLHVVGTLTEGAPGGFAHGGERLRHELVERLALRIASAEVGGLLAQLVVGELRVLVFERVHGFRHLLESPQHTAFAGAEQLLKRIGHGTSPSGRVRRTRRPERSPRPGIRPHVIDP